MREKPKYYLKTLGDAKEQMKKIVIEKAKKISMQLGYRVKE